jgi:hypothetical protein
VCCTVTLVCSQVDTYFPNEMSTRATRGSKRKAPPTPVQKRPPLPGRFTRKCPFTCLVVEKYGHPEAFSCHECDLWKERHGFNWTLQRPKRLVCKGEHKEDQIVYKNKYEWAQKKPKTPMTSENGTAAFIPTSDYAHTTNNSPEGRTSTTQVEITPQQLDSKTQTRTPPPPKILHQR